jgi:hypothetical protein
MCLLDYIESSSCNYTHVGSVTTRQHLLAAELSAATNTFQHMHANSAVRSWVVATQTAQLKWCCYTSAPLSHNYCAFAPSSAPIGVATAAAAARARSAHGICTPAKQPTNLHLSVLSICVFQQRCNVADLPYRMQLWRKEKNALRWVCARQAADTRCWCQHTVCEAAKPVLALHNRHNDWQCCRHACVCRCICCMQTKHMLQTQPDTTRALQQ